MVRQNTRGDDFDDSPKKKAYNRMVGLMQTELDGEGDE
jgi:hypothetical protein